MSDLQATTAPAGEVPAPHWLRLWWKRPWRLDHALRALLAMMVLLTLAATAMSLWANRERWRFDERVQAGQRTLQRLDALSVAVGEYVADFRAYILLRNDAARLRTEVARVRAAETLAQLKNLEAADPAHLDRLERVQRELNAFDAFVVHISALLRQSGRAAALEQLGARAGVAHVLEIRDQIAALQLDEQQALAALESERELRETRVFGIGATVFVLQVLLAVLGYAVLRREMLLRERSAASLAASETMLRANFEQSGVGIAHVTPERCILRANRALARMFGRPAGELAGMELAELSHPEDREALSAQRERLWAGGIEQASGEKRYLRADGSTLWASVTLALARDAAGVPEYEIAVFQDIGERKRVRRALRDRERRLALMADNVPALIAYFDLQGRVRYTNRAYLELFAPGEVSLEGREIASVIGAEVWDTVRPSIERARSGERVRYERRHRLPDGSRRDLDVTVIPHCDASGRTIGLYYFTVDITDRKFAETTLRESEWKHRRIYESLTDTFVETTLEGEILEVSPQIAALTGGQYRPEDLLGRSVTEFFPDAARRAEFTRALTEHDVVTDFEMGFVNRDGVAIPCAVSARASRNAERRLVGIAAMVHDISRRKRDQTLLAMEHAVTRDLAGADSAADGITAAMAAICTALGWDLARYFRADESAGVLRFSEAWCADPRQYRQLVDDSRELSFEPGAGLAGRVWQSGEPLWVPDMLQDPRVIQRAVTERYGVRAGYVFPVHAQNRVIGVLATFSRSVREPDLRLMQAMKSIGSQIGQFLQRKVAEAHLAYLAQSDILTGLPNRALFRDRLDQALSQARRNDWQVGLLFIDLDQFKRINDTLGHSAGDALLRGVGARIQACLRAGDTVARLGGDEFAVVLPDLESPEAAQVVAQKILEAFKQPLAVDGAELIPEASVGITVFPADALDAETLLQYADAAMYEAKQAGRNTYRFYTPEMNARSAQLLMLEQDLRNALACGEFELHYQPKSDVTCTTVASAEALLRWRRADGALVSPAEFIPVLEDSGLIEPVGDWVILEACRQMVRWKGSLPQRLSIAVNISARQFRGGQLLASVKKALAETGIAPRSLEIEVTESMVMHDVDRTIETLQALRAIGVRVAVDDFGTGYSSLAYLKKLPIDVLKIDRAFVKDLSENASEGAIATAIIGMAHALGFKVIAEGVETPLQRQFLEAHGCDEIQGYLLSRPLPAVAFLQWMEERGQVSQ